MDNLEQLINEIRALNNTLVLMQFDIEQIRLQLDRLERTKPAAEQPNIGIVPTLPPDYLPPELM